MARRKESRKPFSTTVEQKTLKEFEKIVEKEGLVKTKAIDRALILFIGEYNERNGIENTTITKTT